MKTVGRIVTAIMLLTFLASCGESSLFIPDIDEQPSVSIQTIENGALIGPDDTIPLAIRYSDSSRSVDDGPDELQIILTDVSTTVEVARSTLGPDELVQEELPPIELTEMPTGFYRLDLTLSNADRVVATHRAEFFHVVESYEVLGIASYPPSFYPSASGLLQANLDIPEGADPYLRWTMNGAVVAEGAVSEGAGEVIVRSPESEGVYPVQVELFPVAPPDRLDYDFESSLTQVTDLYVTESLELGEYELSPEISYYALFHFRGELRDTGVAAGRGGSSRRAVPIGAPDLRIDGDIFGYHLDGESGFELDRMIVPLDASAHLAPFSINMRVLFYSEEPGRTIVSSESGGFAVDLLTAESGALQLTISHGADDYASTSDAFLVRTGEALSISVSVFPVGESTFVMWFRNGMLVGVSELPLWPAASVTSGGTTIIGGPQGFAGILDELGVYFQDEQQNPATYDDAFRHEMARLYGDSLVYAEDFAGLEVPNDMEAEGDVRVMTGELLLEPGARVVFPDFLFSEEDLLLELDTDGSSSGTISIAAIQDDPNGDAAAQTPAFAVSSDGTVVEPATPDESPAPSVSTSGGFLEFRLVHREQSIVLTNESQSLSVPLDDRVFRGVSVALDQSSEAAVPLRVHRVLARQDAISRALAVQDALE